MLSEGYETLENDSLAACVDFRVYSRTLQSFPGLANTGITIYYYI